MLEAVSFVLEVVDGDLPEDDAVRILHYNVLRVRAHT